ncbi:hypothetical protein ZWY2020_003228 [Hordeum vulgare]|nr:hypothetical protein ZWY2020_003228 [Hordeum vulgare]
MSASSSSYLPVPADWLLPIIPCPLCGEEVDTNVARTGRQAGQRFYKCIRYDCRFFEFQRTYCRRMTHQQITAAQQEAGMQPRAHGPGFHQLVPAAVQGDVQAHNKMQAQPQIQPQVQQLASVSNNLAVVVVHLTVMNIMLTLLVLVVVVAIYFA